MEPAPGGSCLRHAATGAALIVPQHSKFHTVPKNFAEQREQKSALRVHHIRACPTLPQHAPDRLPCMWRSTWGRTEQASSRICFIAALFWQVVFCAEGRFVVCLCRPERAECAVFEAQQWSLDQPAYGLCCGVR